MAAGAGTKQAVFRLAPAPSLCSQNTPCLILLSPSNPGCLDGPGGIPGSSLGVTLSPFILTPSTTSPDWIRDGTQALSSCVKVFACYCETCDHVMIIRANRNRHHLACTSSSCQPVVYIEISIYSTFLNIDRSN